MDHVEELCFEALVVFDVTVLFVSCSSVIILVHSRDAICVETADKHQLVDQFCC